MLNNTDCEKCGTLIPNCAKCIDKNNCTICVPNYYSSNPKTCVLCSTVIIHCANCTDPTFCTQCNQGFQFDNATKKCICSVGTEITNTCTTIIGCISSHYIDNILKCLACDTTKNFRYENNACPCFIGYKLLPNALICTPVCGDGKKLSIEQCDDGNILSGDGCSSICTIESGFVCVNQIGTQLSLCTKLVAFTITFVSATRVIGTNSAVVTFDILPKDDSLTEMNFTDYYSATMSGISSYKCSFVNGQLHLSINYNQTI